MILSQSKIVIEFRSHEESLYNSKDGNGLANCILFQSSSAQSWVGGDRINRGPESHGILKYHWKYVNNCVFKDFSEGKYHT